MVGWTSLAKEGEAVILLGTISGLVAESRKDSRATALAPLCHSLRDNVFNVSPGRRVRDDTVIDVKHIHTGAPALQVRHRPHRLAICPTARNRTDRDREALERVWRDR